MRAVKEARSVHAYAAQIREVEHGCFTPLIFSIQGGMSKDTTTMHVQKIGIFDSSEDF